MYILYLQNVYIQQSTMLNNNPIDFVTCLPYIAPVTK